MQNSSKQKRLWSGELGENSFFLWHPVSARRDSGKVLIMIAAFEREYFLLIYFFKWDIPLFFIKMYTWPIYFLFFYFLWNLRKMSGFYLR